MPLGSGEAEKSHFATIGTKLGSTSCLRAKFGQHAALRNLLVETGSAELIEHTENDSFWADGGDGSGQNMLGVLLMELRDFVESPDFK